MARDYPLPGPDEWLETASPENDNPWDYLRLTGVWAYPPRFAARPVRKRRGEPASDPPETFQCVEIRALPKYGEGTHRRFPCICRTAQGDPLPPEKRLHETKTISIRHTRQFGLPTFLVLDRRRFKCARCGRTWLEDFDGIETDIHLTDELRTAVVMTAIKRPFRDAEALLSVPEGTVRRIFGTHAATRLKAYRFDMPSVIGVDEVHLTNRKKGNFVITDLKNRRILDFGAGKTRKDMERVFKNHKNKDEFLKVEVFVQDMSDSYKSFASAKFPNAKIVIDKFHVIASATKCMDRARIAYGARYKRHRKYLSSIRLAFLEDPTKMSEQRKDFLAKQLRKYPRLAQTHTLLGHFCGIFGKDTRVEAEHMYGGWKARVLEEKAVYFYDLVKMVDKWRVEIFNYFEFRERYNNGFVEALNGRLRRMYEASANMDFQTLRAKALLRYGEFYGKDDFKFYHLGEAPRKLWRRYDDGSGPNLGRGLDPDALVADLERGTF
jgi:transposase